MKKFTWVHDGALFMGDNSRSLIMLGREYGSGEDIHVEWEDLILYWDQGESRPGYMGRTGETEEEFVKRADDFCAALNAGREQTEPALPEEENVETLPSELVEYLDQYKDWERITLSDIRDYFVDRATKSSGGEHD